MKLESLKSKKFKNLDNGQMDIIKGGNYSTKSGSGMIGYGSGRYTEDCFEYNDKGVCLRAYYFIDNVWVDM